MQYEGSHCRTLTLFAVLQSDVLGYFSVLLGYFLRSAWILFEVALLLFHRGLTLMGRDLTIFEIGLTLFSVSRSSLGHRSVVWRICGVKIVIVSILTSILLFIMH